MWAYCSLGLQNDSPFLFSLVTWTNPPIFKPTRPFPAELAESGHQGPDSQQEEHCIHPFNLATATQS